MGGILLQLLRGVGRVVGVVGGEWGVAVVGRWRGVVRVGSGRGGVLSTAVVVEQLRRGVIAVMTKVIAAGKERV